MEQLLQKQISQKLLSKVQQVLVQETNIANFTWFKKHFSWLAAAFKEQVNHFYLHDVLTKSEKIVLSTVIQKELQLYFWVLVNGVLRLKYNWQEIFARAQKVNSPIISYFPYYQAQFQVPIVNDQLLFAQFTERWEALLIERIVNYKLQQTIQMRQKFLATWTNNIKMINNVRNLSGFAWNFFGHFWTNDVADFKKINLNIILQYGRILEQNPAIMEIARLLGRWKGTSTLKHQQVRQKVIIDYELQPAGKWPEEIVGITEGQDLEHLLSLELVNLAVPALQVLFYKKFIEAKLAISEFQSMDLVAVERVVDEVVEVTVPESEGPIIICIDTSKSMRHSPEIIAKSLVLAVTKIALQQTRPCYMINFAHTFVTYDLSDLVSSLPNLITFLANSFSSNTNINPAFSHALAMMTTKTYRNADLLLVSDFFSANIAPTNLKLMLKLQVQGNRFHAINIANGTLKNNYQKYFTNYWYYDPRDPLAARKIAYQLARKQKQTS